MAELSEIVERLAIELGPVAGVPEPLDGGITNRNYRVVFGERVCVVRLPGRDTGLLGIDRAAERIAGASAAALGIAPALLHAAPDCLVTEFLPGAPIDGDRLRGAPDSAVRALRAFHDSGTRLPVRFWVPDLLVAYRGIVCERGGSMPARFDEAQRLVARVAEALPLIAAVPCHNDLLPGNVLARDDDPGRALLVDWEYAGMGHRFFDLGNLAVNNDFDAGAEDHLLTTYFGEPPSRRPARRADAVQARLRRARGGLGRRAALDLRAWTSTSMATPTSTSRGC